MVNGENTMFDRWEKLIDTRLLRDRNRSGTTRRVAVWLGSTFLAGFVVGFLLALVT